MYNMYASPSDVFRPKANILMTRFFADIFYLILSPSIFLKSYRPKATFDLFEPCCDGSESGWIYDNIVSADDNNNIRRKLHIIADLRLASKDWSRLLNYGCMPLYTFLAMNHWSPDHFDNLLYYKSSVFAAMFGLYAYTIILLLLLLYIRCLFILLLC